jgi:hypothetical protein
VTNAVNSFQYKGRKMGSNHIIPTAPFAFNDGGIFLAQILGHKLLGPNAALSVGQSYKDFYVAGD